MTIGLNKHPHVAKGQNFMEFILVYYIDISILITYINTNRNETLAKVLQSSIQELLLGYKNQKVLVDDVFEHFFL